MVNSLTKIWLDDIASFYQIIEAQRLFFSKVDGLTKIVRNAETGDI